MSLINNINCYTSNGNTGIPDCDKDPGRIVASVLVPRDFTFPTDDTEDSDAFIAAIQAGLSADLAQNRFFAFGPYEGVTMEGEDAVRETGGYGRSREVRQPTIVHRFTIWGGPKQHAEHYKFRGQANRFAIINLYDTQIAQGKVVKADGESVIGGFRLTDISVSNYMLDDGTNGGRWEVAFSYMSAGDFAMNSGWMQLDSDALGEGTGLISVDISATSSAATNLSVTGTAGFSTLANRYGDDLADVGAWVVKNAATGVAITPTSVALTGNAYVFVLPTGGSNPGAGGKVTVQLAAPSALAALTPPVIGIVSDIETVTLG